VTTRPRDGAPLLELQVRPPRRRRWRGRVASGLFIALLVAAGVTGVHVRDSGGRVGLSPSYPPATKLTAIAQVPRPRPPYLVPTRDPTFATTLVRISDQLAFRTRANWLRNTYAKSQAWNSDGTRLLLGYGDQGWLLDGATYRNTGRRLQKAEGGAWSNVDPDTFYATRDNELIRLSATSGREQVLAHFNEFSSVSIGRGEGSPSNDDRTLVLIGEALGRTTVLSFDPLAKRVVARLEVGPVGSALDWAATSQSGSFIALHWDKSGTTRGTGVELLTRDLKRVRHLYRWSEHADFGVDAAGNEVYVTFDYGSGANENKLQLVAVRLRDGRRSVVLSTEWTGTHVSCRNLDRPGWCYVSDANASTALRGRPGHDEVFAVFLDGSGIVERYGHAYQSPEGEYGSHAMAVPSRDGARVLFGSDWGRVGGPVYGYVAGRSSVDIGASHG
jgi:hypothetical protein